MSTTRNADGTLSIASMSLVDFLPEVLRASKEGYELNVESNAGYPQMIGHLLTVTMFKAEPVPKNLARAVHTEDTSVPIAKPVGPPNSVFKGNSDLTKPSMNTEATEATVKIDGRRKKV
jgi:hypothetical protein